ncbi:LysR family transcriptional regulator [Vibrio sp.]|uniref:LysR family transcriptional regulator n=1 Tax=Vibrio viridaestus TaxID=2487322 RepID=A0A3N9TEE9_9VIBR|nr:LysR family transcriptional regulator [Vibrio viridaestus]MDC0610825.1 LysR family transcriptional regulator [Vibrio sp.]RQW62608.1 LysR family transcriptional regulator [Vibrio viridaestus]
MNLKQLETFVWIANLKSFRLAAEHLCTTQPAISTRISNLEKSLGAALFYRDNANITLTEKGQELLPFVENILAQTEELKFRADTNHAMSGLLRIGISETLVHTWMPEFLSLIHEEYPAVEVELIVDATVNLSKELLNRSIDIAILMGPITAPEVINIPISSYPLHWIVNPDLLIEDKSHPFSEWPIITYARNTLPFQDIYRHFKTERKSDVRYYTSSSLSAMIGLVESGVGIATLPREVIREQLTSNQLKELHLDWVPSPLQFTISYINQPARLLITKSVQLAKEIAEQQISI